MRESHQEAYLTASEASQMAEQQRLYYNSIGTSPADMPHVQYSPSGQPYPSWNEQASRAYRDWYGLPRVPDPVYDRRTSDQFNQQVEMERLAREERERAARDAYLLGRRAAESLGAQLYPTSQEQIERFIRGLGPESPSAIMERLQESPSAIIARLQEENKKLKEKLQQGENTTVEEVLTGRNLNI